MRSTCRRIRWISQPSTRSRARDRTHVFTANYVYELPFFRDSGRAAQGDARRLAGVRHHAVVVGAADFPDRERQHQWRPPRHPRGSDQRSAEKLPADVIGGVFVFNPAAFARPADGSYGNTGRSIFRLPGVHQWDITLSKNWYPVAGAAPAVPRRLHQRVQPHAARSGPGAEHHDSGPIRTNHWHPRTARDSVWFPGFVEIVFKL